MRERAERDTHWGMTYMLCSILEYVSDKDDVSNGGCPTSMAYMLHPMAQRSAS